MWWHQEWHVWAGLGLGIAGLLVGIGAWIYAARANKTAGDVQDDLEKFKASLETRLENERLMKYTPPVVAPPASFVPAQADNSDFHIVNNGQGAAYNVRIEPATIFTKIYGDDRWGEIPPNESVKVILHSESSNVDPAVHVYWEEDASGNQEHRELSFPFQKRKQSR